jgi:alpha-1,2-mannosyltransferase
VAARRLRLITTAAATVLVATVATVVAWRYLFRSPIEPMVDLQVYERAGDAVRHGRGLYEDVDTRLVFTYPPFAALAAAVVAPFTGRSAQLLWTLATVAAATAVVYLSFRVLIDRAAAAWRPLVLGALVAIALAGHPFVEHVFYGQVNVFLVLLCLVDLLVVGSRRWQGALVGVATALKLTPGVFGVHLWLTNRRRRAVIALATFAACTALAFVVVPSPSIDFWTREIYEGQRVAGSVTYTSNQSLLGFVARLVPGGYAFPVWLAAAAAVAVVGFTRARGAHERGDVLGGIALVSLLAVLLSPIAWIHHFVWFVPVLGALVADGRDRRRVFVAVAIAAVLLLRLPWWGWGLLDEGPILGSLGVLLHNAYALLAIAVLIGYPVRVVEPTLVEAAESS